MSTDKKTDLQKLYNLDDLTTNIHDKEKRDYMMQNDVLQPAKCCATCRAFEKISYTEIFCPVVNLIVKYWEYCDNYSEGDIVNNYKKKKIEGKKNGTFTGGS